MVSVPEDREQVLKPILERDPNKGAELLRAVFEARLAELHPSKPEQCTPASPISLQRTGVSSVSTKKETNTCTFRI